MAFEVSPRLKELLTEKNAKTGRYAADVAQVLAEVRRLIVAELAAVETESYGARHLRRNLASIEGHLAGFGAKAKGLVRRGVAELLEDGAGMPARAGEGSGLYFGYGHVGAALLDSLQALAEHLVDKLSADALARVRGELTLGVLGQKTPFEVSRAIEGSLTNPGIFDSIADRAQVITRTELARAYSAGTQRGMETAAATVPDLEKQWWHAGHPKRARIWHLNLSGQHVPVNEPFRIGASVALMYPRDPKAPVSETIRCGCEVVPWHPGWGKQELPKSGKRRFT